MNQPEKHWIVSSFYGMGWFAIYLWPEMYFFMKLHVSPNGIIDICDTFPHLVGIPFQWLMEANQIRQYL